MVKNNECFICHKPLKMSLIDDLFAFWKSPFRFIWALMLLDDNIMNVVIPLCTKDYEWARKNRTVAIEVIQSKMIAAAKSQDA